VTASPTPSPIPTTPAPAFDPDRFFDLKAPGSQEWWYFDAISDDGQDALVVILFAGLPFDPSYGMAAKRHLKRPDRHPAPHPLDHCGISFGWYRPEGGTIRRRGRGSPGDRAQAYALNAHRRDDFSHDPSPFRVGVGGSRVERDADGYRITVEVPDWDPKRRVNADLRFRPAAGTEPFEVDLGGDGSPHHWILAAADCRVEGTIAIDGPDGASLEFKGRGYHDHNAGAEELSLAMTRWEWGRVHDEERTEIYYIAEPKSGRKRSLWLSCRDGKPEQVREEPTTTVAQPWKNEFSVPYHGALTLSDGEGRRLQRWNDHHVDSGPFYQRWLAEFRGPGFRSNRVGFSELLDTNKLNHPLYNWMIPYRLRRQPASR
jgi:carotenoid 1,2-hydratase